MYTQGSNEFNTLIETPNNQSLVKRLVLIDDGTEIENVLSVNLVSSSSQDELQIGTTNMAYIEVSAVTDKILTNREVRLECGVKLSNGTIEYAPIGVYTIQKPKGGIDGISFKANDKMQKFEKPYISSLAYPTTSDKVLEELCDMCGVELTTPIDNPISISEKLDGYTCREMLGYIAGIHAKFACFDRLGKLNLRWYSNTPIEKKIGLIYKFSKAENDFTVSKIELAKDAETKYTSGSGFGAIYYSNPLATQEIADGIFSKLNGFTYNATSLDILDDIRLDLGDVIKVTYLDGMDYLVPCMSLKQNFSQGSTTIEAYSKTEEENEYKYTGPTTKYIERVAHELLIANKIIATKVDAEYVQAHAITTDNLEAIEANITNLVVEQIKGQYADIHLANIDIADIGQFFADSGLLKDVTIVEGHITGELDAVRINADVIKTGTLSVDRLLITGEDSIVYQINVDSSGLTKAELEDEVYQKYLNGTNIVANSITATQLNVSEIFANKTVTNTLFAQNITATGTITGATLIGTDAEITSGKIGGFDISNGKITITNQVYINPTYKECELVRAYNLGTGTLTPQQLSASDINKDGVVNLQDALMMRNLLLNKATIYSYQSNPTLSDVTFTINPADANKTIEFKGVNSWGEAIDNYIGINSIKTSSLTTDGLIFKDCGGEKLEVTSVLKTPKIEFGSNYAYYLNEQGGIYATNVVLPNDSAYFCKDTAGNNINCMFMGSNNALYVGYSADYHTIIGGKTINLSKYALALGGMVVPNNIAYYCINSAGTDINAVFMTANNVLRFGYGASDIWIGAYGTTTRMRFFASNRIDFCINTPDNEDTSNPALALVSGASGANLTLRPTSVNACATYLGSSSYWFNTVYYATLSQISDRNTKKDICDISDKYITLWDKLSVKTFRYINDDKTIKVGLIAQDVEKCAIDAGLTIEECGFVLKEYVDNEDYKGYRYSLDYTGLATITMAKVKQIVDIINQHDKRIQESEDEIAILKARINHMQSQYA